MTSDVSFKTFLTQRNWKMFISAHGENKTESFDAVQVGRHDWALFVLCVSGAAGLQRDVVRVRPKL